jgi:hypothetical protein
MKRGHIRHVPDGGGMVDDDGSLKRELIVPVGERKEKQMVHETYGGGEQ